MDGWSGTARKPGRGPVLASIALHVLVAMVAWWAHRSAAQVIEFISYEIDLVAFEEIDDGPPTLPEEELVVETPDDPAPPEPEPEPEPEPPPPDPEPEPTPEPEPEPAPAPEPEPAPERPREERPPSPPETVERAEEVTSAEIAVRMEGLQRDFPAYYTRIITEIDRCFRPPGRGNLEVTVRFDIRRDGSVPSGSIDVQRPSGQFQFDVAAVAAVECAGAGRFGPLPDDLPWDVLPILFTFRPARD
jgi:outer membrane biosynthesis protein TonB